MYDLQHGCAFVATTKLTGKNRHGSQFAESLRLSEANDAVREYTNLYSRAVRVEGTARRVRPMRHVALGMKRAEGGHEARLQTGILRLSSVERFSQLRAHCLRSRLETSRTPH